MTCRQGEARPASAMRQRGRLRGTVIAVWMASWMMAVLPLASPCGAGEAPDVLYVDDDAPAGGDGLAWATAITHLRDALGMSGNGKGFRCLDPTPSQLAYPVSCTSRPPHAA